MEIIDAGENLIKELKTDFTNCSLKKLDEFIAEHKHIQNHQLEQQKLFGKEWDKTFSSAGNEFHIKWLELKIELYKEIYKNLIN